jgi:hypothetical protein
MQSVSCFGGPGLRNEETAQGSSEGVHTGPQEIQHHQPTVRTAVTGECGDPKKVKRHRTGDVPNGAKTGSACNPSYSGGRDQEYRSLQFETSQAKSL